jgi:hypothetical protein
MAIKKIGIFVIFMLFTKFAFAGITITPVRVEAPLPPGGSYLGKYTVRNDYDVPIKVNVSARDWFVLPENRGIKIDDWLVLSPREISLKPGESGYVDYSVTISTKSVGALVGMVSFVPVLEKDQGFTLMVSAGIFIPVKGTEKIDWSFSDVKVASDRGKLQVSALVKNSGNIYLRPEGSVTIRSGKKAVQEIKLPEGRPVYPGRSREVIGSSDAIFKLEEGSYKASISIECYGQKKMKELKFIVDKAGNVIVAA